MTEPDWIITNARTSFPHATYIDLSCDTSAHFDWMRITTTNDEIRQQSYESTVRLLVQEGAHVLLDKSARSLFDLGVFLQQMARGEPVVK